MNLSIYQQNFFIYMYKQDTLLTGESDNALGNFRYHKDEKLTLEEQDIEKDYKNLVGKKSDIKSHTRDGFSEYIAQTRLLGRELSSSLIEIRFSN